jgi:DNA repair exonuclease SbcCD nuclease subunit
MKILCSSDWHLGKKLENKQRIEEQKEVLNWILGILDTEKPDVFIVAGDIYDTAVPTAQAEELFYDFASKAGEKTLFAVIAGNHDLVVNNSTRKDAISAIFETANFENCFLLDAELGYQSGCVIDDNVTWVVYSIFNDFLRPDIEQNVIDNPHNKIIGLFHGMIVGAQMQNNSIAENGLNTDIFQGCDCVMAGDIHKRQTIKRNGVKLVYPGSMIQQTFGETVSQHGFVLWDMVTMHHEFIDLDTCHGLYDIEVSSIEDFDANAEVLLNA